MKTVRHQNDFCLAALLLLAGLAMPSTHAATDTWSGGGSDNTFTNTANWGGTAPNPSGDLVFFAGSTQLNPTNNQPDDYYSFNGITFSSGAGAFAVTGNRIDLNGGITNSATTPQTLSHAVALLTNSTVNVSSSGGVLTNAGVISGSYMVSKSGTGILSLLGANTFSGVFSNWQGTAQAATLGLAGTPGSLGAATNGIPTYTGSNLTNRCPIVLNGVNNTADLQYIGPGETTDRGILVWAQDGHTATLDASGSGPLVFASGKTNIFAYINNSTAGDAVLALAGTNTGLNTLAGDINDSLYNTGNGLALYKTGPGTWYLQGAKHQKGLVNVQNGVLMFDSISNSGTACALGVASKTYVSTTATANYQIALGTSSTSGTLQYTGSATNSTTRQFGLNGNGTISAGVNGGSLILNGTITNLTSSPYTLTLAGGGANTVGGVIYDGPGQTSLIVSNTGIWALTNASPFSGSTEPVAGELQLGNGAALQNSVLDLEGSDTGTVDFGTITSLTLGGLESGLFTGGARNLTATNDAGAALPLTLTKNDGNTYTYSGVLKGGTTLTKTGSSLQYLGSLVFSGNTTINAGTLGILSGGSFTTPQINVAGGATLDVNQLGGLTLSAGNVLAGAGTVNGSVNASAGSTISLSTNISGGPTLTISGTLTLNGGATNVLNLGPTTNPSVNDVLTVNGSLALNGVNTLVLNPYLGSLAGGIYPLIEYSSLASGGLANLTVPAIPGYSLTLTNDTVDSPNVLSVIVQAVHIPASLVWKGNGSNNNWDVQTTADWLNGATAVGFYNNDSVTFNDSSTNPTVNVAGTLVPAAIEVNNSSLNYTFAGSGLVTGPVALTKDGTGTLTVLTTDNNLGGTTINSGTVQVGNGGASGWLGSGTIVDNGALVVDLSSLNTLGVISGTGNLTQAGGGVLTLTNDTSGFSGPVTVNNGALAVINENGLGNGSQLNFGGGGTLQTLETSPDTFNRPVQLNAGGGGFNHAIDLTLNSTITGTGALILEGAGQSIIPSAESYTGGTILAGGSLAIDSVSALGTNALTVTGGKLFRAYGGEQLTMTIPVNLATNLILGNAGDGGLTFNNGPWTLQGPGSNSWQLTINTPVEIDSPIGQDNPGLGLTKAGAQLLTLTGSNTFTGQLAVSLGQVTITGFGFNGSPAPAGVGNGTGTSAPVALLGNSSPTLQYVGPGETTDKSLYVNPQDGHICTLDASGLGALVFTNNATNIFATIQNATPGNGTLILTSSTGNTNILAGDIYDNLYSLANPGFGTNDGLALTISNSSWFMQGVKHQQGRVDVVNGLLMFDSISNVGTACALGTAANSYNSTTPLIYKISLNGGVLEYTGSTTKSTDRAIGLVGPGTISSGAGGGSLVLNGIITNMASANTLTLAGAGSGSAIGGVISDGPGGLSLALSDVGSWTLGGANTYTGGTTVSGGTLLVNNTSGSATGGGAVQVNSGTFGGAGMVTGNVTYADGTQAKFTVGSPLTIGGSLILNGNTVVHLQLPYGLTNGTYTLATYNNSGSSGAFVATPVIDLGSLGAGGSAAVSTGGGVVRAVLNGLVPPAPLTIGGISLSGTTLVLTGAGGLGAAGQPYNVLMSTNLAQPLSLWTPVATNAFAPNGNFTNSLPASSSSPAEFFRIVVQ